MPYDANWPPDHAELDGAPFRAQFQGLKALIDAQAAVIADLQAQLAPFLPVLARDGGGNWSVAFAGTLPDNWQVWRRFDAQSAWQMFADVAPGDWPQTDAQLVPAGAAWWQIKVVGVISDYPMTAFSNTVSFGSVPP